MSEIVLARIDDRLVHGQVMTSWLNYLSANMIIVVDDETASNPLLGIVLKNVIPSKIGFELLTVDEAVLRLKGGKEDERIILLVKYPQTMETLIDSGVEIKAVNVGGMALNANRKTVYKWLAASLEEKESVLRMIDKGIDVGIQIIAEDRKLDAKNYFKKE